MNARTVIAIAGLSLLTAACDADEKAEKAPETATAPADTAGANTGANTGADAEAKAEAKDPHAAFTDLAVDDVDGMLTEKGCVPVDANGKGTREKYGVVPGAVLLSSYEGYDASELPEDKSTKLVFYCGGQACTAAPKAAAVAKAAGYEDVNVMRAGIRGWVDAGKKVATPST